MKTFLYIHIAIWIVFLLLGKAYSREQLIAANFLAEKNIINNWSKTPPRYKFNGHIWLVDTLNMSLSLWNIKKNQNCRWDFIDSLSSYNMELCRTFETSKDAGIFDPKDKKISPLQSINHKEFTDIMFKRDDIQDTYYPLDSQESITRGEAFVRIYQFLNDRK